MAFKRTGTLPNSITINGNSFRTGTIPNSITINGNTFKTSGGTLTINGVAATGGPGPTGPPGLEGRIGPTGPPGIPYGPPPTEQPVPGGIDGGTTGTLVSQAITTTGVHRVLVTGGGNMVCNPCSDRVVSRLRIVRGGVAEVVVTRLVQTPAGPDGSSFSVNEMIVTPNVCDPCTYSLTLSPPAGRAGRREQRRHGERHQARPGRPRARGVLAVAALPFGWSGEGGIRTRERAFARYSLSRRVPSATRPPLRGGGAV